MEKNNDVHKALFFLTGVYKEAFSDVILKEEFFEELSKDDKEDWKDKHGEDVMSYFNQSLITKIGRPALKMLRFVPHCLFRLVSFCFVRSIYSVLRELPRKSKGDKKDRNSRQCRRRLQQGS